VAACFGSTKRSLAGCATASSDAAGSAAGRCPGHPGAVETRCAERGAQEKRHGRRAMQTRARYAFLGPGEAGNNVCGCQWRGGASGKSETGRPRSQSWRYESSLLRMRRIGGVSKQLVCSPVQAKTPCKITWIGLPLPDRVWLPPPTPSSLPPAVCRPVCRHAWLPLSHMAAAAICIV
jgi:hypothetical protein